MEVGGGGGSNIRPADRTLASLPPALVSASVGWPWWLPVDQGLSSCQSHGWSLVGRLQSCLTLLSSLSLVTPPHIMKVL